jgi:hypothetical protein
MACRLNSTPLQKHFVRAVLLARLFHCLETSAVDNFTQLGFT